MRKDPGAALLTTLVLWFLALSWGGACLGSGLLIHRQLMDDGDTVIIGYGGWGPSDDALPASSIASNNLAPDGGGMSRNEEDVIEVQLIYASDVPGSDGDSSGASNDALLVFRTQHDGSHALELSHFDGSSFTAPTRLYAPDMDPSQPIHVLGAPDPARQITKTEDRGQ